MRNQRETEGVREIEGERKRKAGSEGEGKRNTMEKREIIAQS